jgi:hypothetical protein
LLILLASPAVPRGAAVSPGFIDDVTRMFGTTDWLQPLMLRQRGHISPGQFRAELGNLLRWRLENELGYHSTHLFQVRRHGESGTPLYDLIFATDNAAGDKIMRNLFTRSTRRFPEMAAEARAMRSDIEDEAAGRLGLFTNTEIAALHSRSPANSLYVYEPPWRPGSTSVGKPIVRADAHDPRSTSA